MMNREFYEALITKSRNIISDLERIGCVGFDLKSEGLVSENAAFNIAGGSDCLIVLLREVVSACQNALDVVDRKAYATPLSDYESRMIYHMAKALDFDSN